MMNWLWQGAVVAAATTCLLALTRLSARRRYIVWCFALALVLMVPAVAQLVPQRTASIAADVDEPQPPPGGAPMVIALPDRWWTSSAVAIGVWAGWAVVHGGQLLVALLALLRAKRRCQPLGPEMEEQLSLWIHLRTSGRRARLMLSNGVPSAAVLGGRSPIVALSPTVIGDLTPDEIDAIVAHEWAHVQRRDDLAAMIQAIVRVLAGWHPAVWWLDRQISRDREYACDEAVLELTGSAKRYAACLVKLAGVSTGPVRPLPVVAVSGTGLRRRVVHVLTWSAARQRSRRWAAPGAAAVLVILALSVASIELVGIAGSAPAELIPPENPTRGVDDTPSGDAAPKPATNVIPRAHRILPVAATTRMPQTRTTVSGNAPEPAPVSAAAGQEATSVSVPAAEATGTAADSAELPDVSSRAGRPNDAPIAALPAAVSPGPIAATPVAAVGAEATPWSAAADAGVAIGRGSQKAAVATAGFFSRMGRKIASSF